MRYASETILEEDVCTIGKPHGSNHSPQAIDGLFKCCSGSMPSSEDDDCQEVISFRFVLDSNQNEPNRNPHWFCQKLGLRASVLTLTRTQG